MLLASLFLNLLAIAGLLYLALRRQGTTSRVEDSGAQVGPLFSSNHGIFFRALGAAQNPDRIFYFRPHLDDLHRIFRIQCGDGSHDRDLRAVDCLILRAHDWAPLAAITLDDCHGYRGLNLPGLCEMTQIQLLTFYAQPTYDAKEIARRIDEALPLVPSAYERRVFA